MVFDSMIQIFDTHAHYDDKSFDEDREQLLNNMQTLNVSNIVNVAANMRGCEDTLKLIEKYPYIYGALGVHPDETKDLTENDMLFIEEHINDDKIVAVGEIGLDYYWDSVERDVQKKWFVRQMEIARQADKPVIIHSREAAEDTYEIMKEVHAEEIGGVVHCFSYSKEMAAKFLDMGFYIGIGGVVTFKNAKKVKEAVEYIPVEKIVTETDCPYLAPDPYRGSRNDSGNIRYVIKAIAELKGMEEEALAAILFENAKRLYRII